MASRHKMHLSSVQKPISMPNCTSVVKALRAAPATQNAHQTRLLVGKPSSQAVIVICINVSQARTAPKMAPAGWMAASSACSFWMPRKGHGCLEKGRTGGTSQARVGSGSPGMRRASCLHCFFTGFDGFRVDVLCFLFGSGQYVSSWLLGDMLRMTGFVGMAGTPGAFVPPVLPRWLTRQGL